MANRQVGPIAKELIEAKARIADPANWCVDFVEKIGPDGQKQHCAIGAVRSTLWPRLHEAALALFGAYSAPTVNNTLGHDAVMRMYDHAIEQALKEGV